MTMFTVLMIITMFVFQFAGRLQGRRQGPLVLDLLQVGALHHHHLRQPRGAPENDCKVKIELHNDFQVCLRLR